jgi:general secretion pathway protein B
MMSFILNALRKSEQERQSLQPEAVTDRIMMDHLEPKRNRSVFFYVVLVIGNILIITAIAWFVHNRLKSSTDIPQMTAKTLPISVGEVKSQTNVTQTQHEAVSTPTPVINQVQQDVVTKSSSEVNQVQQPVVVSPESLVNQIQQEKVAKPDQVAEQIQSDQVLPNTQSNTSSIAEWVESQVPKVDPSTVKPVIKKMAENEGVKPSGKLNSLPTVESSSSVMPVLKEDVKGEPILPDVVLAKNDIPFLSELPYEVRRSIPKITINVFVYSENAEESFVMIDMVKVRTGQSIQEGMVLKEIRPNSLVISYQGRIFQVGR